MATLTVAKISGGTRALSGATETCTGLLKPAYIAAAGGGDQFPNDGHTWLAVAKAGSGSINVTIVQQNAEADGFKDPKVMAITAGEERWLGPFEKNLYDDASGYVQITYSSPTDVTVKPFSLPNNFWGL